MDGLIVHLVRHGQSFNTHRPAGQPYPPNPPLTPTGLTQARLLAQRLAALSIDRVFTSPMRRAVETALVVSDAVDRPAEVWSQCYEYRSQPGYPSWGACELRARYPSLRLPEDMGNDDWYFGEEDLDRAISRANVLLGWLREEANRVERRQFVIVTHGAFTRIVLSRLLSTDLETLEPTLEFENTSLTTLILTTATTRVVGVNDTTHLASNPDVDPLHGVTR